MKFTIDTSPKKKRKIIYVSVTRIAGLTGYSRPHLSRVFRGETRPSFDCLVAIASALNLTLDEAAKKIRGRKIMARHGKGDSWTRGSRRGMLQPKPAPAPATE
jgi:transcriptional regulator with XRE-family HTH domain